MLQYAYYEKRRCQLRWARKSLLTLQLLKSWDVAKKHSEKQVFGNLYYPNLSTGEIKRKQRLHRLYQLRVL